MHVLEGQEWVPGIFNLNKSIEKNARTKLFHEIETISFFLSHKE